MSLKAAASRSARTPAGGLLWRVAPAASFVAAGAVGLLGALVFAATGEEGYAG